jgi:hypothetical protein
MGKKFVVRKNAVRTIPELELDATSRFYAAPVFIWLIYGVQKPTVYVKNRLKTISETKLEINY